MKQSVIKIIITGASGRMGRALAQAIAADKNLILAGVVDIHSKEAEIESLFADANVVVDFSSPAASVTFAKLAAKHKIVHIIGTTGFNEAEELEIFEAAKHTSIVKSGNFSIGVNVLAAVTEQVARTLAANAYDIEIVEMHHNQKVDAPSGTALLLGKAAANGRGVNLKDKALYQRFGHTGARIEGEIGFATLRGGTVIGDHSVIFAGNHERVELSHKAESRTIFADGALAAGIWAIGKPAGLYSMLDVLGL